MMDRLGRMRARVSLGHWLGPWTPGDRVPSGVHRQRIQHVQDGRTTTVSLYRPVDRPLRGSLLVAHGVHFLGPIDPRLDRFCRVLSRAGWLVAAPFMPAYRALIPDETVPLDFAAGLAALRAQPDVPPGRTGVFSISFGSMPALHLASTPEHADRIGGLVVFGGYADWTATLRYMVDGHVPGGEHDTQRNPLSRPVVFMNLLPFLPGCPADPAPLTATWRRFVHHVWPDPEMKDPEQHGVVAEHLAQALPPDQRRLFLQGCGLAPGGDALAIAALERGDPRKAALLDLRPRLAAVRCPTTLVHGMDDDVIHHSQVDALGEGLINVPRLRRLRTGLYGHSASGRPRAGDLIGELSTLVLVLDGIARAATDA